jgi:putative N6-adenine-specific DNA methylase
MSSPQRVKKRQKAADTAFSLFATTQAGLEEVLAGELKGIGARNIVKATRGVAFSGDLATMYRANLWSRTADRVLLKLDEFDASDRTALYEGTKKITWWDHLSLDKTLSVDAVSHQSEMNHTQFISRVVKDAIVDQFRERKGRRPNVDTQDPDLRLNARLFENRCTLSIDTSGERLHRRGYRPRFGVQAPLKETLAAGILLKSGFDGTAPLIDPMCGSGTFLIEGAMIAKRIAPGLLRSSFGFMRHPSYKARLWEDAVTEARALIDREQEVLISGSDHSDQAVRTARSAIQGAGVDDLVRLRRTDLGNLKSRHEGMVVTNPPYGERLGEMEALGTLYESLGDVLKQKCKGMTAHVLTGSRYLAGHIGLHPKRRDILFNGAIECRLLHYDMF